MGACLAAPLFSQDLWLLLGTHDNYTYEIYEKPYRGVVLTRNKVLEGEGKDWYLIKSWELNCKKKTLKEMTTKLYSPDDSLVKSEVNAGDVYEVKPNSIGEKALAVWCK